MHADTVDKTIIPNSQSESVYTREDEEGDILCLDGQPYQSMPDITVTNEGVLNFSKRSIQAKPVDQM